MIRRLFSSVTGLARRWAYRRQGRDHPPLTLHRRRIYILPTRFGMGLALLVMAMILAAMNYANSMGFALSFTLAGLGVVCMHHAHRGLNRLVVRPGKTGRGFAGERQHLEVQLENPAPIARRDILLTDESGNILDFTDLFPHGHARLQLPCTPERRGSVRIQRFGLATAYPMGLFRAWCWLDMPLEGLAWPKPLASPMQRAPDPEAESGKRQQSGTEDFSQLRDYAKGDPTRRIAWRHYLARGELIVKEFASPAGESPVWLDWDHSGGGDQESRLARLCHWVLQAEAATGPWGLRLPDETIGPGRGEHQTRRALDALARFGEDGGGAGHD
ncbi:uncharacterized protein (DUF58 family) [Natronospira proteinivora]|uniref:Uncharacterized protein (DUF58 family) n=1 Tax=Natronospira proteinivora TaxID=1807133 RepID=A0ABT1G4H3_9GAMM|nr:DUF58 domain-containing protein [Natronospira proteinivora]MCP1726181.1 uncharacterized protein (DUF58 family) [Natronospira proteinivora]